MDNTAIFIDYDNIYVSLENYYENTTNASIKTNIIHEIKQKYNTDNIYVFKAFADFQKVNPVLTDLQVLELELRHVYSNNANTTNRKNASDIAMTIDVMKTLFHKTNITKFVLASSDSDMLPLVSELKYNGKKVELIYSAACSTSNYGAFVQNATTIESILNIPTVYQKINEPFITGNLRVYLETINNGLWQTYRRFNNSGTASKKDIVDYLWNSNIVRANATIISEYLFNKNILISTPIPHSTYFKVMINPQFAQISGVPALTNAILTEQNFQRNTQQTTR